MPNALKNIDYLKCRQKEGAKDLKHVFLDCSAKGVMCFSEENATYKINPYFMEDEEFITAIKITLKYLQNFPTQLIIT